MFTFTSGAVAPKSVCVLPSTRTCTRTAAADGARTRAARTTAENLRFTESSFREGFVFRRTAGLLTRGALPSPPSRPLEASGVRRGSISPHSGGTVPDLHRRSPTARLCCGAESTIVRDGGIARAHALAAGRPLGGADLRALIDPEPRHRPRHVGSRPAQVRSCYGVRGARAPARPRGRTRGARAAARRALRDER